MKHPPPLVKAKEQLLDVKNLLLIPALTEKIERTVQIEASTVEIEERGVKLRLTVVDTPGYGDAINSQDWCQHPLLLMGRSFRLSRG